MSAMQTWKDEAEVLNLTVYCHDIVDCRGLHVDQPDRERFEVED